MFCLNCYVSICPLCAASDAHRGHEFKAFGEYIETRKSQASLLVDEVESRRKEIETSLQRISVTETDVQIVSISQKDHIISLVDQLRRDIERQLEEHQQTLFQQLNDRSKEKLGRLAQQRKQLEKDLDCLENSVSFSRSLLKNATDDQLVTHLPLITDQLNRLKKDNSFNQNPVETSLLETTDEQRGSFNLFDRLKRIHIVDKRPEEQIFQQPQSHFQQPQQQYQQQQQRFDPPTERPINHPVTNMTPVMAPTEMRMATTTTSTTTLQQPTVIKTAQPVAHAQRPATSVQKVPFNATRVISKPSFVLGMRGTGRVQFNKPTGVIVDRFGRLIVCDSANHRVQIIDGKRNEVKMFGSRGGQFGSFDTPHAVSLDSQSTRIAVCDRNNHRIQIFDDQGNFISSIASRGVHWGQLNSPEGVAVDHRNSRIIVCDYNNHRVQIFDFQGTCITTFGSQGVYNGQFNFPSGIVINRSTNNIVISDEKNHRIQIFDDQGNHIRSFGSFGSLAGQFNHPQGVAIDLHNNIIVCDTLNHRIQIFDDQGNVVNSFGSQGSHQGLFSFPQGVTVDHLNNIIVCDTGNHRIQIF